MASTLACSIGFMVLAIASLLVVALDPTDPCAINVNLTVESCYSCVNQSVTANQTCYYITHPASLPKCSNKTEVTELGPPEAHTIKECNDTFNPTPTPSTTTTSTSTTSTTPASTTATSTTTTTAPSTTTTKGSTTTTVAPPSPTTTAAPSNTTTAAPHPAPSSGGFAVGSFFFGIIFTLCISGLGYLVWRFYKARLDRNYHTLSTNNLI